MLLGERDGMNTPRAPLDYNKLANKPSIDDVTLEGNLSSLTDLHLAPINSPNFSGTPTAPTPTQQSGDTQIANKKYVDDAVAGATLNLDYVMRVDPVTGGIYYTTPDANA